MDNSGITHEASLDCRIMNFSKVLVVKSPSRANWNDAGIDFYVPENTEQFRTELVEKNPFLANRVDASHNYFTFGPHDRLLIPSGIKVLIPKGYMLCAFNKSGVAAKKGLVVGSCVVDESYQGQVHLSLINSSKDPVIVEYGEKIVQFILLPVLYAQPMEVNVDDLYKYSGSTARGDGGFGSSGIK